MPAMQFKCPHCQQVLTLANQPPAGGSFKCPRCGKAFAIGARTDKAPPRKVDPPSPPAASVSTSTWIAPTSVSNAKPPKHPASAKSPPPVPPPVKSNRGQILLGVTAGLFLLLTCVGGVLAWSVYLYFKGRSTPSEVAVSPASEPTASRTSQPEPEDTGKQAIQEEKKPKPELQPASPPEPEPEPEPTPPPTRPKGTTGADGFEPFPVTAPEQRPFQYNLVDLTGSGAYKLVSGPSWLSITPEGILKTGALPGYRGSHKVVFTVSQGSEVETFRYTVQVAPPPSRAVPGARRPIPQPPAAEGTFRRLPTEAVTTAIEPSEDGKFLFAAHQEANKVSVWDVRTAKLLKTLETPEPRALLCRAGKLFVSSNSQPVLRVFAGSEGWKLADELKVGSPVFHLTAPRGTAYQDQIITNAVRKEGPAQYLVEVGKDQFKPITAGGVSNADAVGRYLLMDKMGADYREAIAGGRLDLGEGGAAHLAPAPRAGYWCERDGVWAGMPPQLVVREKDMVAIPDLAGDLVYFLGDKLLKARLLKTGLPEVGSRAVSFPASYAGAAEDGFFGDPSQHRYLQHVAVTTGGRLHLYALTTHSREIYHARLPAFDGKTTPPTDNPAKESGGAIARAVEGRAFTHQLPNDGGTRTFTLLSGPEGLKLDADGKVHWTPGKPQVGSHEIKARVTAGDKTSIERFPIEVLDKDLVAAAGGDVNKAGGFSSIELTQNPHRLAWSLDRKHLLLLQGRQLDVLSPDGRRVERSLLFDRYCQVLAERTDYYVGMSPLEVRLLDKQTGKTLKTLSFKKYRRLHDLAIHPTRKLTYVALENTVEAIAKNRADWQRVVQIDEESGALTELDEVYGRFLAVDSRGQYLYTGFKDIYTRGLTFHINPGGRLVTFPKYGNIDILFRYKIDGETYLLDDDLHDAGGNGNGLALSPDGEQIAYLSNGGYPSLSRNVVVLRTTDFQQGAVTFATKGKASCMTLVYHPLLPLAACPSANGAVFFDRKSGSESPNRLKLTAQGLGKAKVEDLIFSPDGKDMVFVLSEPGRPWYVRSVPLTLSAEEANHLKAGSR